jgi:hypothetical protein
MPTPSHSVITTVLMSSVATPLIGRPGVRRDQVIGRTAGQILFSATGSDPDALSLSVIHTRVPVVDRLRLYTTARGQRYWCLTSMCPIPDASGAIGVFRDLARPNEKHNCYRRLLALTTYVEQNLSQNMPIAKVAQHAGISVDVLDAMPKRFST